MISPTPEHQLCCLCASWIAADCLDEFEGEPCHKICKAKGVGRAHKTHHVESVQCCMPNESAIDGFCYFAETRKEWNRCWDRCEKQFPLSESGDSEARWVAVADEIASSRIQEVAALLPIYTLHRGQWYRLDGLKEPK